MLLSVGGRKERVEFLLSKGANIEAKEGKDGNGLTLLQLTAAYSDRKDYLDVVKLLLEKGADIETRGYGDCTPLQTVAGAGRIEAAELLKSTAWQVSDAFYNASTDFINFIYPRVIYKDNLDFQSTGRSHYGGDLGIFGTDKLVPAIDRLIKAKGKDTRIKNEKELLRFQDANQGIDGIGVVPFCEGRDGTISHRRPWIVEEGGEFSSRGFVPRDLASARIRNGRRA